MSLTNVEEQLKQQLTQLEQLSDILKDEKLILQQHDPEALHQITNQKNELLASVESLDQMLNQSTDFHQEKQLGKHQGILTLIKQKLLECKELNVINGQIIQQSQLAVDRMKTTLLDNHSKSTVTYDNKGKKSGGLSSLGIKA